MVGTENETKNKECGHGHGLPALVVVSRTRCSHVFINVISVTVTVRHSYPPHVARSINPSSSTQSEIRENYPKSETSDKSDDSLSEELGLTSPRRLEENIYKQHSHKRTP
jgi:hypothetical protein